MCASRFIIAATKVHIFSELCNTYTHFFTKCKENLRIVKKKIYEMQTFFTRLKYRTSKWNKTKFLIIHKNLPRLVDSGSIVAETYCKYAKKRVPLHNFYGNGLFKT